MSEIALPAFGGLGTGTAAFLWWRWRLNWPAEWPLNRPWISSIAWGLAAGLLIVGAWVPTGYGLWQQDLQAGRDTAAVQAFADRMPENTQATVQSAERFDSAYLFVWADDATGQKNATVRMGSDRWVDWRLPGEPAAVISAPEPTTE